MEFAGFTEKVRDEVGKIAGENCRVRIKDVRKNNGTVLRGLIIMHDGNNISPTIYLNNYYKAYENGNTTIMGVVKDVINAYNHNKVDKNVDMGYFLDFSKVREKIVYKLINTEMNKELLEDIPHVDFLDMSIVFQCLVARDENTTAAILIHNAHTSFWNTTADELYKAAMNNTQNLLGYELRNMNDIIGEMMMANEMDGFCDDDDMKGLTESLSIYILTNKNRVDGASCILYPNMLENIAVSINSGYYIIPSSIHEVIIVPSDATYEADEIRNTIREVNDTQVEPDEILSYSVYYFDSHSKKLLLVKTQKEMVE